MDWVEIIEPRSRLPMYANLESGQCSWQPPDNVMVRRAHDNQWWELFDTKTRRYYYYNVKSQQTVWKRPDNGDVIPLTKLQTMKRCGESVADSTRERLSYHVSSNPIRRSYHQNPSRNSGPSPSSSANTRAMVNRSGSLLQRSHPDKNSSGGEYIRRLPALCTPLSKRRQIPVADGSRTSASKAMECVGEGSDSAASSSGSWGTGAGGTDGSRGAVIGAGGLRGQSGHVVLLDSGVQSASTTAGSQRSERRQMKTSFDRSASCLGRVCGGGGSRDSFSPRHLVLTSSSMNRAEVLPVAAPHTHCDNSINPDNIEASPATSRSSEEQFADDEAAASDGYTSDSSDQSSANYLAEDERYHCLQRTVSVFSQDRNEQTHGEQRPQLKLCMKTSAADADSFVAPLVDTDSCSLVLPAVSSPGDRNSVSGLERIHAPEPQMISSSMRGRIPSPQAQMISTSGLGRISASDVERTCTSVLERISTSGIERISTSGTERNSTSGLERTSTSGLERDRHSGLMRKSVPILQENTAAPPEESSIPAGCHQTPFLRLKNNDSQPASDCVHPALSSSLQITDDKRFGVSVSPVSICVGEPDSEPRQQLSSQKLFELLKIDESVVSDDDGLMEKYVRQNISQHKRGLFRRKVSARDMLSWSKDGITESITLSLNKSLRKPACQCFRLVQIYMGDRKCSSTTTLDSVGAQLIQLACSEPALCDELFVQICRQTTDNPSRESLRRGWELMAVCLHFFKPTARLWPYLEAYIGRHRQPLLETAARGLAEASSVDTMVNVDGAVDELACAAAQQALASSHAGSLIQVQVGNLARVCSQRLQRESRVRNARKTIPQDIDLSRMQIFRPSMFGCSLNEAMLFQRDYYPHLHTPWVFSTLIQMVLDLDGMKTEGIFRVAAEAEEVAQLKMKLDLWHIETHSESTTSPTPTPTIASSSNPSRDISSRLTACCSDAHAPASLLKQWLRQLWRPLIPEHLYISCVKLCQTPDQLLQLFDKHLPNINRLTLICLIRFLQNFSSESVVSHTKMDANNLSMVFAPNILRFSEANSIMLLENARKEVLLVRSLIQFMDTDGAADVL